MERLKSATASLSSTGAAHQGSPGLEGSWDAASTESEGFGGEWQDARAPTIPYGSHDTPRPSPVTLNCFSANTRTTRRLASANELRVASASQPWPLDAPCPGIPPQATPTRSRCPAGQSAAGRVWLGLPDRLGPPVPGGRPSMEPLVPNFRNCFLRALRSGAIPYWIHKSRGLCGLGAIRLRGGPGLCAFRGRFRTAPA